jgi:hypothetical protein
MCCLTQVRLTLVAVVVELVVDRVQAVLAEVV